MRFDRKIELSRADLAVPGQDERASGVPEHKVVMAATPSNFP